MNAHSPPRQTFDGRPELRQEIIALLGTAICTADLAQGHAALGDDRGLQYCMQRTVECVRVAAQLFNMIAREETRLALAAHEREVADGG